MSRRRVRSRHQGGLRRGDNVRQGGGGSKALCPLQDRRSLEQIKSRPARRNRQAAPQATALDLTATRALSAVSLSEATRAAQNLPELAQSASVAADLVLPPSWRTTTADRTPSPRLLANSAPERRGVD